MFNNRSKTSIKSSSEKLITEDLLVQVAKNGQIEAVKKFLAEGMISVNR